MLFFSKVVVYCSFAIYFTYNRYLFLSSLSLGGYFRLENIFQRFFPRCAKIEKAGFSCGYFEIILCG